MSSTTTNTTVDHHHHQTQYNYNNPNQLDFTSQDHNLTTKPPQQVQEPLFSSTYPLFMFDTSSLDGPTTTSLDSNNINGRPEMFQQADSAMPMGLSSGEAWNNLSHHHQVQALINSAPSVSSTFTGMVSANGYLPPLIENVDSNMVPIHEVQIQSCSMEEEGEMALECLQMQRQELNEWVDTQQQCSPNFIFWENVEGQLGGEEIAPNSSNLGTHNHPLSSFPSSL